tara:strand:+ start:4508 stop:4903 length:396 start_codon:yes stop_codon:yes gene_type:complete
MVQWIVFKAFTKKAYLWVKTYWYVPIGAMWAIITWFFFRQKASSMVDNFNETRKAHRKEVDIITKSKEDEVSVLKGLVAKSREEDKAAQAKFKKTSEDIKKKSASRKKELVDQETAVLADKLKKMMDGESK